MEILVLLILTWYIAIVNKVEKGDFFKSKQIIVPK